MALSMSFPVINQSGKFLDFTNMKFESFQRVIENLPMHELDYPGLRIGSLGLRVKRWYVEGFDRFWWTGQLQKNAKEKVMRYERRCVAR